MKSQIFKQAWIYFRMYKLTFSQALTKAWRDIKKMALAKIYREMRSDSSFWKKRKQEAKEIWQNFKDVDFEISFRNTIDNSGAAAYYADGTNFYNSD
jgi:hypothetical protein